MDVEEEVDDAIRSESPGLRQSVEMEEGTSPDRGRAVSDDPLEEVHAGDWGSDAVGHQRKRALSPVGAGDTSPLRFVRPAFGTEPSASVEVFAKRSRLTEGETCRHSAGDDGTKDLQEYLHSQAPEVRVASAPHSSPQSEIPRDQRPYFPEVLDRVEQFERGFVQRAFAPFSSPTVSPTGEPIKDGSGPRECSPALPKIGNFSSIVFDTGASMDLFAAPAPLVFVAPEDYGYDSDGLSL